MSLMRNKFLHLPHYKSSFLFAESAQNMKWLFHCLFLYCDIPNIPERNASYLSNPVIFEK